MNWFQLDLKKLIIIAAVIILPLFTINLQKPGENLWIFRPFSAAIGSIQNVFISFSTSIRETASLYVNLIDIKKESRILTAKINQLETKLLQFKELEIENERLNKLMDFRQRSDYEILSAKIIALDLLGERFTVRVNRGRNDNIKKGMAVISPKGVVGYVLDVHSNSALVLLITDRYAIVDAIVQHSRARGIVEGNGPNSARLKYLQRSDEVNEGDLVVSSGLDNIFPKGFPIGYVKSVSKNKSDITQYVELSPAIDPAKLEEVFIIQSIPVKELEKIESPSAAVTVETKEDKKQTAKNNDD